MTLLISGNFYFSIKADVDFQRVVKLQQDETLTLTLTQKQNGTCKLSIK